MAQAAWATEGAHFFSATSSIDNNGALVVNFDEAGVGQQLVNYTLNADSTVIYACINGGGNHPKASNKETVSGAVSGQTTARPKNGRVVSSLSAGPLSAGSFSCPSGQTLVLAKVTYSGITLTDTTNGVSTAVTPDPICRSFSMGGKTRALQNSIRLLEPLRSPCSPTSRWASAAGTRIRKVRISTWRIMTKRRDSCSERSSHARLPGSSRPG